MALPTNKRWWRVATLAAVIGAVGGCQGRPGCAGSRDGRPERSVSGAADEPGRDSGARPSHAESAELPWELEGAIAFARPHEEALAIEIVELSDGEVRRIAADPARDLFPGPPSPDGRELAVIAASSSEQGQPEQLALVRRDGGEVRPLGPSSGRVRNPSWFPGGGLAFESDREGFRDIYRIESDGAELMRLTTSREGDFQPHVAPDGERIAFVSSRDGSAEIYVMDAGGENAQRLTAFHRDDTSPLWAPDGEQLVFVSARQGRDQIFAMAADGSGQRPVLETDAYVEEARPVWSPDGKKLAFEGRSPAGEWKVGVVDLQSGEVIALSAGLSGAGMPSWSPDGEHVALSATDADGELAIFVAPADGSNDPHKVAGSGARIPRWLPARD